MIDTHGSGSQGKSIWTERAEWRWEEWLPGSERDKQSEEVRFTQQISVAAALWQQSIEDN